MRVFSFFPSLFLDCRACKSPRPTPSCLCTQVYAGDLSGGRKTAVLFNRSPEDADIVLNFEVRT